jgi:excisionase family DNA binding protein
MGCLFGFTTIQVICGYDGIRKQILLLINVIKYGASPMQNEKSLLAISVPEARRRLGIGRSAAYAAAAKGQLPVMRIGGLLRVPLAALERKLRGAADETDNAA